jgi:hypothetical protein
MKGLTNPHEEHSLTLKEDYELKSARERKIQIKIEDRNIDYIPRWVQIFNLSKNQ